MLILMILPARRLLAYALCAICTMLPLAVHGKGTDSADTLYQRLGGKRVVAKLVGELIDRSTRDARTQRTFEKINVKRLKEKVEEQICALADGPCTFAGDDMKQSHAGLNITESEFYGFVEVLIEVLDSNGIGLKEKNQLLAILAPMKRDIVTR